MFDPDACYDAAVLGGGLCGFAAARRLARGGARVLLAERRPTLGWEATWAFHLELGTAKCETARWLCETLTAAGGCRDGRLDAPILEMVLDRGAAQAGIDLLLYAQPVGVARRDGRLTSVVLGTKQGEVVVRARAFVDATENALVWRLAGGHAAAPERPFARHTLFLNGVPEGRLGEPLSLGDVGGVGNVSIHPSIWPGEAAVAFSVPSRRLTTSGRSAIGIARRALPAVLRAVREGQPALADALVTAVGHEPYPLATWHVVGQDEAVAENLFPAAPWAHSLHLTAGGLPVSTRLGIGEHGAKGLADVLDRLPEPPAGEPPPHSRVAPPAHEADVVVCGGGTGGAFAAIAAARRGASTVLLEQSTCLGGIGTGGGIHSYYHGVAGGIQDEADRRLEAIAPLFGPAHGFHPEAKKVVLELMAHEAGVQTLYGTTITGVQAEPVPTALPAAGGAEAPRRLVAVVAAGPEGNATVRGRAFVDGTGDGDVAAMAGAPFTFGREADGLPHAYSLAAGRLGADGALLITNFDAGYCDPTDVVDITRARRRALGHYWNETFDAASRLVYVAPILGLRNSRQVVGDYRLRFADEVSGRQFPDVVGYAFSHFDNHGFDYANESDEAMLWVWLLGNWSRRIGCEIPYRALLPQGVEGLVMGCRALSLTHDAHNQLRMQRDLQRIGEAAGTAAALSAARGIVPRELPIEDLQAALVETRALGKPTPPQLPAPDARSDLHDESWLPAQPPALPAAEWAARLGTEESTTATWELIRKGDDALPLLLEAARSELPAARFWASVALAMLRRPEAAPELRACLAERRADLPEGRKTAPLWQSAAVLLGRLGDREALPELCRVLEDPEAPLDALIAVVRAIGRIGDPAAAPALEALLDRADLPAERRLQVSVAAVGEVVEDARWQLDLAAAEALAKLGRPRPDVAQRHLADERLLVRRYARRVAENTPPLSFTKENPPDFTGPDL